MSTERSRPPSLYPTLDAATLVPLSHIHYPYIPAVNFTLAGITKQKFYLDRGPLFDVEDISGVMREPPIKGGAYSVRQPQVDEDGNTIAGCRTPTCWYLSGRISAGT